MDTDIAGVEALAAECIESFVRLRSAKRLRWLPGMVGRSKIEPEASGRAYRVSLGARSTRSPWVIDGTCPHLDGDEDDWFDPDFEIAATLGGLMQQVGSTPGWGFQWDNAPARYRYIRAMLRDLEKQR